MNISASTASRNMFSKGHVHKHPLWRIKTVVLGFLTNKNNHSVIRATAGGYVQPNKQGFVHLDLPTEGPQGVGGGWKWGGRSRQQGQEETRTSIRNWAPASSPTSPAEATGKDSPLGVLVSSQLRRLVSLWWFHQTFQTNYIHREHCMGNNSISHFFSNKVAH